MTRSKFIKYAILGVFLIFFLLPIISSFIINNSSNNTVNRLPDKAKAELGVKDEIKKSIPNAQLELANVGDSIRSRAAKTDNNIVLTDLRSEYGVKLCQLNPTINSWVAKMISIQRESLGGSYRVFLEDDFNNEYWVRGENAVRDDAPLINQLRGISMNQYVRFSGSLLAPKYSRSAPGEGCVTSLTWETNSSFLLELQEKKYRYEIVLTDVSPFK
mgnify:CR=1 FL=1